MYGNLHKGGGGSLFLVFKFRSLANESHQTHDEFETTVAVASLVRWPDWSTILQAFYHQVSWRHRRQSDTLYALYACVIYRLFFIVDWSSTVMLNGSNSFSVPSHFWRKPFKPYEVGHTKVFFKVWLYCTGKVCIILWFFHFIKIP